MPKKKPVKAKGKIHKGPRGGNYVIRKGRKVYVKKKDVGKRKVPQRIYRPQPLPPPPVTPVIPLPVARRVVAIAPPQTPRISQCPVPKPKLHGANVFRPPPSAFDTTIAPSTPETLTASPFPSPQKPQVQVAARILPVRPMPRLPPAIRAAQIAQAVQNLQNLAKAQQQGVPVQQIQQSPQFVQAAQTLFQGNLANYERLEFLGAGAFGSVYKVRDLRDGSLWAMKIVAKKDYEPQMMLFLYETSQRLLSARGQQMVRDTIVMMREAGMYDAKRLFVVYELMDGDLTDLKYTFTKSGIRNIAKQIIQGIYLLHSMNIAHNDLKPANILQKKIPNSLLQVKIGDFGFACTSLALPGNVWRPCAPRTIAYMDPSYFMKKGNFNVNRAKAADVWAIGCTIYELRRGHDPFPNSFLMRLQMAFNQKPVAPFLQNQMEIYTTNDAELDTLLKGLLVVDSDQRKDIRWAWDQVKNW